MTDKQAQKPFTVNQVESKKPNVERSTNILSGYIAGSFNGGHNRTIAYKQIMAGERHKEYKVKMNIQTLTPLTPTYQNLKCTIRAYFVPNSRVWEHAEQFTAQNGGTSTDKYQRVPHLEGKQIPIVSNGEETFGCLLSDTSFWKNAWISSYLPRIGAKKIIQYENTTTAAYKNLDENRTMPAVSALPLRGRIAIYNDYERNKEFDEAIDEFKDDVVSNNEWISYLPDNQYLDFNIINMRAKKDNSYYSDYRTEIQGFNEVYPPIDMSSDRSLITWAAWEHKIAEARSEAEMAQANPWEVIAKIRGSKKLTEGKVQLIGQHTFNLNYAAITQNTYNNNQTIREEFRVLGKQGAYSYTEVTVPLYAGMEFIEEGYVHVIATVSADTVYENAFDRLELNVNALDQYRPDMVNEKQDVLYNIEMDTTFMENPTEIQGFKRKYSEYFKLPNIINGDMTTAGYAEPYAMNETQGYVVLESDNMTFTNSTFQFFQEGLFGTDQHATYPWKDYTDVMINKNQAIRNNWGEGYTDNERYSNFNWNGQNQIFYVGVCTCLAELPIDSAIAENYTTWGEH